MRRSNQHQPTTKVARNDKPGCLASCQRPTVSATRVTGACGNRDSPKLVNYRGVRQSAATAGSKFCFREKPLMREIIRFSIYHTYTSPLSNGCFKSGIRSSYNIYFTDGCGRFSDSEFRLRKIEISRPAEVRCVSASEKTPIYVIHEKDLGRNVSKTSLIAMAALSACTCTYR